MNDDSRAAGLWRRFIGDTDRIGWWTLPAFLAVGLAGAVMAGALAVVYYSQQVADLEAETRQARQDLQAGVEDVEAAREDALAAIEEQVRRVEDSLDEGFPVDDVATLGLVVLEARVGSPPPASATVAPTPPPSEPAPASPETPAGAPLAQPTDEPSSPSPSPSPSPRSVVPRLGVGFAVAFEDGQTFLATSFDLVADPDARAGVVEDVVVRHPDGREVVGNVHSWDENRGIALVSAQLGQLPIGGWRPRTDPVSPGDTLTIVGLTPTRQPVLVRFVAGQVDATTIVGAMPANDFLRGAPIVDRTGRVVAVHTPGYRPFGRAGGDHQAVAPIGLFCEGLLNACDALEVADEE